MSQTNRSAHESLFILHVWCFFCAWVMIACADAYLPQEQTAAPSRVVDAANLPDASAEPARDDDADVASMTFPTVGGLPPWVFWGIAVPWFAASVCTIAFALFGLRIEDDDA